VKQESEAEMFCKLWKKRDFLPYFSILYSLSPSQQALSERAHAVVLSKDRVAEDAENHNAHPPPPLTLTERRGNGGVKKIKFSPSNAAT